ncbi:12920_t:CDS:2 [Acaulospora morrowiae]|uniref:12920_t:CDS:1 n=1 Tax=Acaulospora morrowiae TaxID=94023 RepID=A0A9N8W649_9GLOM|nr:12920_t:CDS:2 [Acaulospora morrowiae]
MSTFSGDEVSAVVLDVGSAWTRAGYAGEDTPKLVFPTSYGYLPEEETTTTDGDAVMTESSDATGDAENLEPYFPRRRKRPKKHKGSYIIGDAAVTAWRPHMQIKNPLVDGMIQDWDALEEIWDHIFWEDQLDIDPKEHPLFVTEAAWNSRENRETLTELAFEKYQTLAFYVAKNPVLSAFAAGRPTAIVVDCGASSTSCVPVVDGYVLKKGIFRQPIGGDFLSEQILQQFQSSGIDVIPHYMIAKKSLVDPDKPSNKVLRDRPNTTDSYHKFMQMRVIHDFKESVCQVFETSYDELVISARPMKTFEFPDGFNTSFGPQRFNIPEILFSPQRFLTQPPEGIDATSLSGIPEMIFHSINACDIDVRPLLWNNIILTGGTTLLPGFADRINNELSMMMSGQMKIKIHAPGNTIERKCSSWLGGSILASLGTFHQLWISQKEYNDYGKSIVEKKCE